MEEKVQKILEFYGMSYSMIDGCTKELLDLYNVVGGDSIDFKGEHKDCPHKKKCDYEVIDTKTDKCKTCGKIERYP